MAKKEVICREAAEEEIREWENFFDVELDEETQNKITRSIVRGDLTLDTGSRFFTMKLVCPIKLENGETLDSLKIEEPRSDQMLAAAKAINEMDIMMHLLSATTKQPLGVLGRLKLRDLLLAGELFNFFV